MAKRTRPPTNLGRERARRGDTSRRDAVPGGPLGERRAAAVGGRVFERIRETIGGVARQMGARRRNLARMDSAR